MRLFGRRDMSEDDKTKPVTGEPAADAKQTVPVTQAQPGEKPKRKRAAKARSPSDKSTSAPDASAEEESQREAARQEAKAAAKAARLASKPVVTPEDLAAKAERKAAKQQAKDAAKAARQIRKAEFSGINVITNALNIALVLIDASSVLKPTSVSISLVRLRV